MTYLPESLFTYSADFDGPLKESNHPITGTAPRNKVLNAVVYQRLKKRGRRQKHEIKAPWIGH